MCNPIDRLIDEAFDEYDAKLKEAAKHRTAGRFLDAALAFENAAAFALTNVDEWFCRQRRDECLTAASNLQEAVA